MHRFSKTTLSILFVAIASASHAACTAVSTSTRPHLVELYSSEGCSSCPPAENWLRTLQTGADVVPLEFHVDYWNDLGWPDRFSDARYTARQQQQSRHDGGTSVFTPQVVLDGRNWSGWYRVGHLAPPEPGALVLRIAAGDIQSSGVRVNIDAGEPTPGEFGKYRTYVALVEDGLSTQVRAGENRGALLHHDHVVRAFAGPLPLARAEAELKWPANVLRDHATIVAFAQEPDSGKVAQVVTLPLSQCAQ
ncbi:MAG: DUF1223 domain-containing protein [Rudaea sp.]